MDIWISQLLRKLEKRSIMYRTLSRAVKVVSIQIILRTFRHKLNNLILIRKPRN